jgi:hypothetical protein
MSEPTYSLTETTEAVVCPLTLSVQDSTTNEEIEVDYDGDTIEFLDEGTFNVKFCVTEYPSVCSPVETFEYVCPCQTAYWSSEAAGYEEGGTFAIIA